MIDKDLDKFIKDLRIKIGKPSDKEQIYTTSSYIRTYDFVGMVLDYDAEKGLALIEQRNKFVKGDEIEFMRHNGDFFTFNVDEIFTEDMQSVTEAPHPQQKLWIKVPRPVKAFDMMRREAEENA